MTTHFPLDGIMGKALHGVQYLRDHATGDISAVGLNFGTANVYLVVNPDDDTLSATSDDPAVPDDATWRHAGSPWSSAVGMRIEWYWWMQNNQGYWDAVQMQFARDTGDMRVTVQVVAIASRLSILQVTAIE
jgi:hypothetical protein